MYAKPKRRFYTDVAEYFLRMTVRRSPDQVSGAINKKLYEDTESWLMECTEEERKLIREFFTYNQSVKTCNNYLVIDCYAESVGLC